MYNDFSKNLAENSSCIVLVQQIVGVAGIAIQVYLAPHRVDAKNSAVAKKCLSSSQIYLCLPDALEWAVVKGIDVVAELNTDYVVEAASQYFAYAGGIVMLTFRHHY